MASEYTQAWWGTWWPWAEANQGLLSFATILAAAAVFLLEQRRANREAASAMREANQRLENERMFTAERDAQRTREADARLEAEQRFAIEREELRGRAAREAEVNAESAYLANCLVLLGRFRNCLVLERAAVAASLATAIRTTSELSQAARETSEIFTTILAAAPRRAEILIKVLRASKLPLPWTKEPHLAPASMLRAIDDSLEEHEALMEQFRIMIGHST